MSARAATHLIRPSMAVFRVGRVVPVIVSASIAACPVNHLRESSEPDWSSSGGILPSGIAVSLVAWLAVIVVSPAAIFAVLIRPVTGFFCVGILSVLRFGSARAGCTSSAQPVRVRILCLGEPQAVFCPAGVARTGKYGEDIFCGPPRSIVKGWETDGFTPRVRIHHINPGFGAVRISDIVALIRNGFKARGRRWYRASRFGCECRGQMDGHGGANRSL